MCLITDQKKPLIAKRDMVVYKIVASDNVDKGCFHPLLYFFNYKLGVLYKTTLRYLPGMNACTDMFERQKVEKKFDYLEQYKLRSYTEGFHSFTKKRMKKTLISFSLDRDLKRTLVQCIIPKGSEYFRGIDKDLLVSNQLIIVKKINND